MIELLWLRPYFQWMTSKTKSSRPAMLSEEWPLATITTLASSVRAKGIMLEVRAHLPVAVRKCVTIDGGVITLRMPQGSDAEFWATCSKVARKLDGIENLPVIPREVEDILTISSAERHRWLRDGRLQSAGTKTVKLRGRARKITFHVFDPRHIEDVLDRDLPALWRDEDALAKAERRRRASGKAAIARARKKQAISASKSRRTESDASQRVALKDWDEFETAGLLR